MPQSGKNNTCPDGCKPFTLSDSHDSDYQEKCKHKHDTSYSNFENHKDVLHNIEAEIFTRTRKLEKGRAEYLQHDVKIPVSHVFQWKAHLVKAQNLDYFKGRRGTDYN